MTPLSHYYLLLMFQFLCFVLFFRICDIDEELILSYICIAMTYNVCESYGYTYP